MAYIKVENKLNKELLVDGFITFINVDENSKAAAHGIEIMSISEEDKNLYQMAIELKK